MNGPVQTGNVKGHLAIPAGDGPWPGMIVIHKWWGFDLQTRSIADQFGKVGYPAFAPDLYHGELAPLGDGDTTMELVQKYAESAPTDLETVWDGLKSNPTCNGRVGNVGFCFCSRLSLILGMRRPLDAVCTFCDGGMESIFDQLNTKVNIPVLGLFGDADESIPVGTVEEFDKLLDEVGVEHEIIVYPNSGHAFFRDTRPNVYKPEASKDASDA